MKKINVSPTHCHKATPLSYFHGVLLNIRYDTLAANKALSTVQTYNNDVLQCLSKEKFDDTRSFKKKNKLSFKTLAKITL